MLLRRLLVCFLAVLMLAPIAGAERAGPTAPGPQRLRAFLLRANEPETHVFPRTPSFAWSPVRGALRYEFQLSTSSVFREGGIVWESDRVDGPAVSIPLALPWITGTPYSLYARVRAVLTGGETSWSQPFGFNVRWPTRPVPLPSYPGLLRWTPVEGATSYDVWFLEPNKIVKTISNVADEREYYTLHQDPRWYGTVRWRIRAVRTLYGQTQNGLPAVSYAPWSAVYSSTNPAFVGGPLTDVLTVSDAVSNLQQSASHRLMPAFVFSGNQGLDGVVDELYRVYVFTDKDCVNTVYRSAIVGGPAYAPRTNGPLQLPVEQAALARARTRYLPNGSEGTTFTFDNDVQPSSEELPPVMPDLSVDAPAGNAPSTPPAAGTTATTTTATPAATTTTPTTAAASGTEGPNAGAPVDLWDTEGDTGRYYWTVVPVRIVVAETLVSSLASSAAAATTTIQVGDAASFGAGDSIRIGPTSSAETATVLSVSETTITLAAALNSAHGAGEPVVRNAGKVEYHDADLSQDVCDAGRWLTFGKTSQPTVVASPAPFASGLSTSGRLIAAAGNRPSFYGAPLVAWRPALGASAYEVQWSKARYPFKPRGKKITLSTSATLPLTPGVWYYRVRGINFSLPTTAAGRMSWSDPVELNVARPVFKVVPNAKRPKKK